ncbi:XRE family transcriptional regulator [Phytoactinopolyspora halotolerans]|uniref:XRE family transcriptional regulator n=2 Tax=Phytoactinopolyspora halotolerans TaxID=1981512 RepID=A0A6L9SBB0_9ACTN|nr:XRE family transcriptional regulator [Phytoactinopolyspora halotolerans]
MARTWKHVKEALPSTPERKARVREIREEMLAEARAHRLAEIREAYGLNQTEVARRVGLTQPRVSRIERGDLNRSEIGTLRSYVEALGGEIEIVAKFGDERFRVA